MLFVYTNSDSLQLLISILPALYEQYMHMIVFKGTVFVFRGVVRGEKGAKAYFQILAKCVILIAALSQKENVILKGLPSW